MIDQFRAAHPDAARVLISDISLPKGGPFGNEYGGLGHVSHQIGLDVDLYYPRLDHVETAPLRVRDIDHEFAQELVDRFIAASAITIYIGPHTGLHGPAPIVRKAKNHDDHLHVRYAKPARVSATKVDWSRAVPMPAATRRKQPRHTDAVNGRSAVSKC